MSYPNQKTIKIKKVPCNDIDLYTKIDLPTLQKAMKELTTMGEMKLWLYLAKNQDNYICELSLEHCKKFGLKTDAYHSAVKKLIEKGYLVQQNGNRYTFVENGQSTEKPQTVYGFSVG